MNEKGQKGVLFWNHRIHPSVPLSEGHVKGHQNRFGGRCPKTFLFLCVCVWVRNSTLFLSMTWCHFNAESAVCCLATVPSEFHARPGRGRRSLKIKWWMFPSTFLSPLSWVDHILVSLFFKNINFNHICIDMISTGRISGASSNACWVNSRSPDWQTWVQSPDHSFFKYCKSHGNVQIIAIR